MVTNAKKMEVTAKVSAKERAQHFKEDLYCEDGILFCKFCGHSVDLIKKRFFVHECGKKRNIHFGKPENT